MSEQSYSNWMGPAVQHSFQTNDFKDSKPPKNGPCLKWRVGGWRGGGLNSICIKSVVEMELKLYALKKGSLLQNYKKMESFKFLIPPLPFPAHASHLSFAPMPVFGFHLLSTHLRECFGSRLQVTVGIGDSYPIVIPECTPEPEPQDCGATLWKLLTCYLWWSGSTCSTSPCATQPEARVRHAAPPAYHRHGSSPKCQVLLTISQYHHMS